MPGATTEAPPSVALSFANNFWGKDDAGVGPMLERMHAAKQTCDELKSFYSARCSIEDDYARKMMSLSRKSLGSQELGGLKTSLDTVRGEVEAMAKQHQNIAAQMKSELEEPLQAFAGAMKERRKIVQNTVEKLLKVKVQQTQMVNKTRDKYEQECLKIKGYLAQGHMVMGQEERKNKAKLEKTQITLATTNTEYEQAVKALEDTTARWNREWKAAADKFQDLEEERLDFTKNSLWTFANIASTVCVSDDASCEKVRLSLEKMEVEKDILTFIKERGTGQEIPDPPKYINFCRGDFDAQSEVSVDDDAYSVAQFPRSINPAFRSSSPQPSTYESHHDPNSALARDLGHQDAKPPAAREVPITPQVVPPMPQPERERPRQQPPSGYQPPRANLEYDPGEFAAVPHDPYPQDGMTMLCRKTGQPVQVSEPPAQPQPQPPPQRQMVSEMRNNFRTSGPEMGVSRTSNQFRSSGPDMGLSTSQTSNGFRASGGEMQTSGGQFRGSGSELSNPLQRPSSNMSNNNFRNSGSELANPLQKTTSNTMSGQFRSSGSDLSMSMTNPLRPTGSDLSTSSSYRPTPTSSDLSFSQRPSSSNSHTDLSSQDPVSPAALQNQVAPVKAAEPAPASAPAAQEKKVLKKKSGFFANNSPFSRKKSMREVAPSNRNTWHPSNAAAGSNNTSSTSTSTTTNARETPARPLYGRDRRNSAVNNAGPRQSPALLESSAGKMGRTASPDPIDANASLALNIGNNVFPVSNPDRSRSADPSTPEDDPIALALAELKGVAASATSTPKQASSRMSADAYHGISSTPAPNAREQQQQQHHQPLFSAASPSSSSRPATTSSAAAPPPPSYDDRQQPPKPVARLGVPPPAVTSKAMKEASRSYTEQTRSLFSSPGGGAGRPESRSYNSAPSVVPSSPGGTGRQQHRHEMPRAASPAPARSASPRPGSRAAPDFHPGGSGSGSYGMGQRERESQTRSASPNPYARGGPPPRQQTAPASSRDSYYASASQRASPSVADPIRSASPAPASYRAASPAPASYRSVSPAPYAGSVRGGEFGGGRPGSSAADEGGSMRGRGGGVPMQRPGTSNSYRNAPTGGGQMGLYEPPGAVSRARSKSVADGRQFTRDGRPIMHYARALYLYQAAIPEELTFAKGDVLAVLRHQDDGWWEATVQGGSGPVGLVPSNYLQPM